MVDLNAIRKQCDEAIDEGWSDSDIVLALKDSKDLLRIAEAAKALIGQGNYHWNSAVEERTCRGCGAMPGCGHYDDCGWAALEAALKADTPEETDDDGP